MAAERLSAGLPRHPALLTAILELVTVLLEAEARRWGSDIDGPIAEVCSITASMFPFYVPFQAPLT